MTEDTPQPARICRGRRSKTEIESQALQMLKQYSADVGQALASAEKGDFAAAYFAIVDRDNFDGRCTRLEGFLRDAAWEQAHAD